MDFSHVIAWQECMGSNDSAAWESRIAGRPAIAWQAVPQRGRAGSQTSQPLRL